MNAPGVPASVVRPNPIAATYRQLLQNGFEAAQAANVAALAFGIPITPQPWTLRQVSHLLFLRELGRARGAWSGAEDQPPTYSECWRIPPSGDQWADGDDGRITLLALFRAAAGPDATLASLAPWALRPSDAPIQPNPGGG